MNINIKNLGIVTSGGDSPGMNSAIKSIVNYANYNNINCIGYKYGYDGIIYNNYIKLSNNYVKNIIGLGGSIIGCGRSKLFYTKEGRKIVYKNLIYNNIDGLIVIGGNGTLKGINLFNSEYNFPIIGIPGTIDNDIYGTDVTLGYDTSLNTIIQSIDKIKDTAISNNRIFIIEVMGKNTGYLALNSGIALNALYIIYNNKYNLKKINKILKDNIIKSNIIVVAENKIIGDAAKKIYKRLKKIIKNYEIRYNILGHIQRGGSPTYIDRVLGIRLGIESINKLIKFKNNLVLGIKKNKIISISFKKAIKKNKKIDKNNIYIFNKFYL
ncbi:MAG: 6-phosphofructokinase [Candidatus Shikimatogenerans sp. JK-2022]|nr:6-phosphofructokinase [Candidatus Shikimatogenerans bostrichidophilus]